jgi:hypothetical protein
MVARYLSAEKMSQDDFGDKFTNEVGEVVYDAVTMNGAWATMTQKSHDLYARPGGLGIGKGQKYVRRENGELHQQDDRTLEMKGFFNKPKQITKAEYVLIWANHARQRMHIGIDVEKQAQSAAAADFENTWKRRHPS